MSEPLPGTEHLTYCIAKDGGKHKVIKSTYLAPAYYVSADFPGDWSGLLDEAPDGVDLRGQTVSQVPSKVAKLRPCWKCIYCGKSWSK